MFEWAVTGAGTSLLPDEPAQQRVAFATDLGNDGRYGLGLQQLVPGWIGHVGQFTGWESIVMYEPATGATFAVLVNATASLEPVARLWIDLFEITP